MANNKDSLKKRYGFKFLSNIIGFISSIFMARWVPRGLGPKLYGDYNFLSSFFGQVVGFFDMGTSSCFYTKLSQRQKEPKLVAFYFRFIGIIFLVLFVFVIIIHFSSAYIRLLPGQQIFYIYLAAGVAFFTWLMQILNQMTDAHGLTISSELMRLLQKTLGLGIILLLYFFNQLNLSNYFYYQYFLIFFLCIAFIRILNKNNCCLFIKEKLSSDNTKKYIKEFYHYTYPIFFYSLVCLVANIFDRWLLQFFGGSIQQGFFGLSYQIGAICFLFTSAATPLITRELSISYADKDISKMSESFKRYLPLFYSITAYFSCFVAVQADNIIAFTGGKGYSGAMIAVVVMAFFPIHQTYGQLSGAMFYATGDTKRYSIIGIVSALVGLPITYFLIAPLSKFGFNLGATGLAFKMVFLQIVVANIMLFFNTRTLKISFWYFFWQQIISVGLLLSVAFFTTLFVNNLGLGVIAIYKFVITGILYTLIIFIIAYCFPNFFGARKEDFKRIVKKFGKEK